MLIPVSSVERGRLSTASLFSLGGIGSWDFVVLPGRNFSCNLNLSCSLVLIWEISTFKELIILVLTFETRLVNKLNHKLFIVLVTEAGKSLVSEFWTYHPTYFNLFLIDFLDCTIVTDLKSKRKKYFSVKECCNFI